MDPKEDTESLCPQYFDSVSPEYFTQVSSNYSENQEPGPLSVDPATSRGNNITSRLALNSARTSLKIPGTKYPQLAIQV